MAVFNFSGLNPDLILDAIESLDLRVNSGLLPLNSYENRVYQFVLDSGQRLVVKFYRPQRWSQAQIQEEHDFAFQLADAEIPLVAPLRIQGQSLHYYQGYAFALFESVGGRQFEVDNLEQLEWVGRFIGRMHRVSQAQAFTHRPTMSCDSYLHTPAQQLKQSELVTPALQQAFFTVLEHVVELAAQHYQPHTLIRLHGDCHPGNILWRDGPSYVDLDDCRTGPAIQDIWMLLSGDRPQQRLQLDILAEAYSEFADFPHQQLTLIEPLRAMRMVHYMGWLAQRWQDPAFPQAFPWFASDKYWEQQILALKEQLATLQEPPLSLYGQPG